MIGFGDMAEARQHIFDEIGALGGNPFEWLRQQGIDPDALKAWVLEDMRVHEASSPRLSAEAALIIGVQVGFRLGSEAQDAA